MRFLDVFYRLHRRAGMKRPTGLERFDLYRLVRKVYDDHVRDRLPRKIGVYNGIPVRDRALLDVTDEQPDYEGALVAAVRWYVTTGDNVVVVGGGRGVSTVSAARATGPTGEVDSFEGGDEQFVLLEETLELNRVDEWTSVHRAVVGNDVDVYGDTRESAMVEPSGLPECDVLVLDCEGAEVGVLDGLQQQPRTIIVETHGFLGTPETEVREVLSHHGYEVVKRQPEYEDRGVIVLTAVHR